MAWPGPAAWCCGTWSPTGWPTTRVRTAGPDTEIVGGRISGGATGIAADAATTIRGIDISQVDVGIRARSTEPVAAQAVTVSAETSGIAADAGSRVVLTDSQVRAAEAVHGAVELVGHNDLSLPAAEHHRHHRHPADRCWRWSWTSCSASAPAAAPRAPPSPLPRTRPISTPEARSPLRQATRRGGGPGPEASGSTQVVHHDPHCAGDVAGHPEALLPGAALRRGQRACRVHDQRGLLAHVRSVGRDRVRRHARPRRRRPPGRTAGPRPTPRDRP